MQFSKIVSTLFWGVLVSVAVTVRCEFDGAYQVENSNNDTENGGVLELVESSPTESSDNLDSITLMTDSGTVSTMAETTKSNATTKPTWIQRIPKKKPKTSE